MYDLATNSLLIKLTFHYSLHITSFTFHYREHCMLPLCDTGHQFTWTIAEASTQWSNFDLDKKSHIDIAFKPSWTWFFLSQQGLIWRVRNITMLQNVNSKPGSQPESKNWIFHSKLYHCDYAINTIIILLFFHLRIAKTLAANIIFYI
jgi:hypothetical protein